MRDGDTTSDEPEFLAHLANRLEMPADEFQEIMKIYLSYTLETIPSHKKKLEHFFTLTQLVHEDESLTEAHQKVWLERMGKGMGFANENITYIADKSLKMIQEGIDLDGFINGIHNINQ